MKEFLRMLKKRRGVLVSLGAILLVSGVLTWSSFAAGGALLAAAPITNWGLSFQTEGQPPVGNATEEELAQSNALFRLPTQEKKLLITFDAGFENGNTEPILAALKKHGAHGVFFLVGHYLETQPDLVRRMVEEGHTVGNHTWSHPDMSAILDEVSFRRELERNETLFREITGQEMAKLYRPPQGKYCESNLRMARELGYTTVFWSLAYVDWLQEDQPSREQAFAKLLPRVHPGAVVLLHSTSATNAQILDELLTQWENAGYSFAEPAELTAGTGR